MKALLDALVALTSAIPAARDVEIRRHGNREHEIVFVCRTDADALMLAKEFGLAMKLVEFGTSVWLEAVGPAHGHVVHVSGPHHPAQRKADVEAERAAAVEQARAALGGAA